MPTILYRLGADLVVGAHLAFLVFVVGGGLLVWRWPRAAALHLPAAIWGALLSFFNWGCPLTPLENWLRMRSGGAGYETSFIERYLTPLVYPEGLTPDLQVFLGLLVVVANLAAYGFAVGRWLRKREAGKK